MQAALGGAHADAQLPGRPVNRQVAGHVDRDQDDSRHPPRAGVPPVLLGVPHDDRDRFRGWTRDAADVRDRGRSDRGLAELFGYGQQLVARKRAHPGADVVSRLCATPGTGDDEIAMLSMFLLFAGHETTVVAIGTGALLLLLTRPAQWRALATDPGLVPAAVEEMLRAGGQGGGGIPRYARTGLQVGGVTVRGRRPGAAGQWCRQPRPGRVQ